MTDYEKEPQLDDLNLTVICGRLAAPPELRQFESGTQLFRLLITVRQNEPTRRIDVLPAVIWEPDQATAESLRWATAGTRVWVTGSLQRRFWSAEEGRRSRIELVASAVQIRGEEETDEG